MKIKINHTEYDIPFDLMDITLDDFIGYQEAYGMESDKEFNELIKHEFENEDDRISAYDDYMNRAAISWFSYWTKYDLEEAYNLPAINQLLDSYKLLRIMFVEAEREAKDKIMEDVNWNGDVWCIQDWKVNPATEMSFNEITTSKDIVRQVKKLGEDRWLAIKYLSAVFFRKKGEKFIDQMVWENGERLKLIGKLPLAYGMRVGFFLSICVNISTRILVSSQETEKQAA